MTTAERFADLFRRAVEGQVKVRLADPERTWLGTYAGGVDFVFSDGYEARFFNDCGDLDYTDSGRTPEGERTEFGEWFPGEFRLDAPMCPLELLSEEEFAALEELLEAAV